MMNMSVFSSDEFWIGLAIGFAIGWLFMSFYTYWKEQRAMKKAQQEEDQFRETLQQVMDDMKDTGFDHANLKKILGEDDELLKRL